MKTKNKNKQTGLYGYVYDFSLEYTYDLVFFILSAEEFFQTLPKHNEAMFISGFLL